MGLTPPPPFEQCSKKLHFSYGKASLIQMCDCDLRTCIARLCTKYISSAYRQREDIAVGLCPNTGNPPCVGQKADLAKIRTVAQGSGYLKKKNKMKKNHFKKEPILNPYLPRVSLVSIVSDQQRQNCIHWEYLNLYLHSYFWEMSKRHLW